MATPRVVMMDRDNCLALSGPIAFQVRGGVLTEATVTSMMREIERNILHHPRGAALFAVLEPGAPVVAEPLRELQRHAIAEVAAKHPFLTAVAVLGDDVASTMQRAATRSALVRMGLGKMHTSGKIPDLVAWVHKELSELGVKAPATTEIASAIDWTRARYAEHRGTT